MAWCLGLDCKVAPQHGLVGKGLSAVPSFSELALPVCSRSDKDTLLMQHPWKGKKDAMCSRQCYSPCMKRWPGSHSAVPSVGAKLPTSQQFPLAGPAPATFHKLFPSFRFKHQYWRTRALISPGHVHPSIGPRTSPEHATCSLHALKAPSLLNIRSPQPPALTRHAITHNTLHTARQTTLKHSRQKNTQVWVLTGLTPSSCRQAQ